MCREQKSTGLLACSKTLVVMLTFACPAECNGCGTLSNPRDHNNLSLDVVLRGIEQAKRLNFKNVVFTGGEATLRWDDLLAAIKFANDLGLPTRLVTNAHWAKSMDAASSALDQLLQAGLQEINFSTGDEHVRFVPFERVIFATIATVKRGLIAHVMVELRAIRQVSKERILEHPLIQQLSDSEQKLIRPLESPWISLDPHRIESYPDGVAITKSSLSSCPGCDNILRSYVMQADGRLGACCGFAMRIIPELSIGIVEGDSFLVDGGS